MSEWFVLKNEEKFGPFSYREMIQLLQENTVYPFDFVWTEGMEIWTPLAEVTEFSPAKLAKLVETEDVGSAFAKRRFPRVEVTLPVLLHNDRHFGTGTISSLSQGGALVTVDLPTLLPNDRVLVHCRGIKDVLQPFNFEFSISSKSWNRNRIQHRTKVAYTGSFSEMPTAAMSEIRNYIENKLTNGGVA